MKKWLVRISYHTEHPDLVAVVKAKDIEKYMNDFVKDILDQINGYEYQELRHLKRNELDLLCGAYNGVDFIKRMIKKDDLEFIAKCILQTFKKN